MRKRAPDPSATVQPFGYFGSGSKLVDTEQPAIDKDRIGAAGEPDAPEPEAFLVAVFGSGH